ncbi:hypothetical protein J6524_11385 [Bradyrhizobium sp. WSM 1738]|uniref:hypothetical protein n=1 Tax=Bradyrhizobium hereditatis TaxID=2821405 RepID=UPI001CE2AC8B|nr:hypothetical protein [Bradyrhizobium hereditatis]MCA6115492.1 hypothetical protein [Bradyrhizobium hereditatis]
MTKRIIIACVLVGIGVLGPIFFARLWSQVPTVEAIDETSPESDATITLSDPLLYARETLINDRRREYDFLTDLLIDSSKIQFSPQLARDLSTLSTASVQVSAALNTPTAPSGEPKPMPSPVTADQDRSAASRDKLQYSPNEEFRDRQAYRNELRAALASVNLDDLHDFAGNALFRLQFKASVFPGKQKNKYGVTRLTLVAPTISAADLETLYLTWLGHISSRLNIYDAQGNLVVDGRYQSTGIAPAFTDILKITIDLRATDPREDICLRYQDQLNASLPQVCSYLALAVGPSDRSLIRDLFRDRSDVQLLTFFEQFTSDRDYFEQSICRDPLKQDKFRQIIMVAKTALEAMSTLGAAFNGIAAGNSSSDMARADNVRSGDFLDLRSKYIQLGQQAARMRDHVRGLEAPATYILSLVPRLSCAQEIQQKLPANLNLNAEAARQASSLAPKSFTAALINGAKAKGQAYGLGTAPSELGQRLTTTARASASLDIALALQASRKQAEMKSAADMARSAAQTAAALERIPLVVGFSDRRIDGQQPSQEPQFGWVFGPRIRTIGASGLTFEHGVAAYDVSADVSVPSWWPRLDFQLETAWVKNWYGTADVLPPISFAQGIGTSADAGHKQRGLISIPLPLNRADLDGLTKFLTGRAFGATQELTSIRFVEPSVISACAKTVTFLIYGANIWRNTEVYFGGLRAKQITVLPDMEGIAATFELMDLLDQKNSAKNPLGYEEVALRVNTRNGNDWRPIRVMGQRAQNGECQSPYNVTTPIVRARQRRAPVVFELSPSSIQGCADPALIVLSGQNLVSVDTKQLITEFYLGGQKADAKLIGAAEEAGAPEVVELVTKMPPDMRQVAGRTQLIAANRNGMVSMSLEIAACSTASGSKKDDKE